MTTESQVIGVKNQIKVYRNELKYFISFKDYLFLKNKLQRFMHKDAYSGTKEGYFIRSLYFDTLYNTDYYDKMFGTKDRKKIRLRIYDVNQEKVKVEIKNKFNDYMLKETASIYREDATELIRGNKEVLLDYNDSVLNKVYYFMSKDYYRPTVLIDYEREAYMYPIQNIRITIDKNVRASITNFDIFNPSLNLIPAFEEQTLVLEVKFNRLLPDWIKETLSQCGAAKSAISKYCIGRWIF